MPHKSNYSGFKVLCYLCFTMFFYCDLQIEYPENVHLIRGNHEAADINALFGFRLECIERMVLMKFLYPSLKVWVYQ